MKKIIIFVLAFFIFGITWQIFREQNLKAFYIWTKEDPLFTSPDFNEDKFLKSVEFLGTQQNISLDFFKLKNKIFPIDFLKDITQASKLHKAFLAKPDQRGADNLIKIYYKTAEDYRLAVDDFLTLLNSKDFDSIRDRNFVSLNTATNLSVIRADLKRLKENAIILKKEIEERQWCLSSGVNCRRVSHSFTKKKPVGNEPNFSKEKLLPREVLLPTLDKKIPLYGPFLVKTRCFGLPGEQEIRTQPLYVYFPNNKELPEEDSKLATTNYYKRIIPRDPVFGGKGLNWIHYRETNIYLCADSSYQNTLASLYSLWSKGKDHPLFDKFLKSDNLPKEIKTAAEEGKILEDEFFKAEFPSEVDAENLVNYYAYFYHLTDGKKDEFLERYLNYSRKLSDLELVLGKAASLLSAPVKIEAVSREYQKGNYTYLYILRSAYGLIYLAFSPSFYRLDEPLEYFDKAEIRNNLGFEGGYLTYQQALERYSPSQIEKWSILGRKIKLDILNQLTTP
ncbi:MAG: hypothetical protein AAB414_05580 [Patescibacteria group bacterium]